MHACGLVSFFICESNMHAYLWRDVCVFKSVGRYNISMTQRNAQRIIARGEISTSRTYEGHAPLFWLHVPNLLSRVYFCIGFFCFAIAGADFFLPLLQTENGKNLFADDNGRYKGFNNFCIPSKSF